MAPKSRGGRKTGSQASQQSLGPAYPPSSPGAGTQSLSQSQGYEAASLPAEYTITVALQPKDIPLSEERERQEQINGEEALSDAWRRDGDVEGQLQVAWASSGVKRRRLGAGGSDDGKGEQLSGEDMPLWYTAGLSFPCSCQLAAWHHAYQPRYPAPRSGSLLALPPHDTVPERPIPTNLLPEWEPFVSGAEESTTDLEPSLDELKDFEPAWKTADGGWGRVWVCEELDDVEEGAQAGPSGVRRDSAGDIIEDPLRGPAAIALPSPQTNRGRGKEREKAESGVFRIPSLLSRRERGGQASRTPSFDIRRPILADGSNIELAGEQGDWQAESKRRKQVWREMIRSDSGYEKMWTVIKRHHPYPAVSAPAKRVKRGVAAADYILPTKLSSIPHPYHPSLPHHLSSHPNARLHWIIPINGPVCVPGINIPTPSAPHALSPSIASLSEYQPLVDPTTRPFPLAWTPPLLLQFMEKLVGIYQDSSRPYGSLSISLSGPKPDPFLDLPIPAPLATHAHLPSAIGTSPSAPVRPECGDHIRVYVDAKYALGFRTWLHNVEIPLSDLGDHWMNPTASGDRPVESSMVVDTQAPRGRKRKGLALFNKVRLILVGERGEALVVA